ncbi:MAG: DUF6504 family protein [Candidatus Eremiobacteraeota bacterium]|nr:DUF6504 family protein [Candidatus Eremiobacteraeota bacterium]
MPKFVSEPIAAVIESFDVATMSHGEPSLPSGFVWREQTLMVGEVLRTWRGTKVDRGDTYLKRHWFEFRTTDGRTAVVYFDRQAKPGAARWWLYTIALAASPGGSPPRT